MNNTKYRVWDKNRKQMFELVDSVVEDAYMLSIFETGWELIRIDAFGKHVVCGQQEACGNAQMLRDDGILMRHPGIKDRNKKDIFEGDIVQFVHGIGKIVYGKYVTDNNENEDILGWMVQGLFEQKNKSWRGAYALDPQSTYKIIGNIYKNPELLERHTHGQ